MDRCQNDRAAGMDGHVDLIAHLDPGQIHERSIENDALRISDLRNGLRHDVILCFTKLPNVKRGPRLTLRCLAVLPCMSLASLASFRCFAAENAYRFSVRLSVKRR